ncbi:MAG TPA: hypothetical protein VFB80_20475, partial [Pirellulaceae bacterium]|nr:hypothetical protein [Pirellulaceae bacterium]
TCRQAAGIHYVALAPQARGPQYAWVGCLLKNEQGEWAAHTPLLPPAAAGSLAVLRKDSAGAIAAQPIGRAESGKAALDRSAADALTEGRPIYLVGE